MWKISRAWKCKKNVVNGIKSRNQTHCDRVDGFAFNPSALSVTYGLSFALGLVVAEPVLITFRFYVLGVRAILVHEGTGNGGVPGSSIAPSPVASGDTKPPGPSLSSSSSSALSSVESTS